MIVHACMCVFVFVFVLVRVFEGSVGSVFVGLSITHISIRGLRRITPLMEVNGGISADSVQGGL